MANSRFVSIFICLVFGIAYLTCLPIEDKADDDGDRNETSDDYILIDQRQNGSENYRINIDGVIIAFSPLDSLLSGALDDFDFTEDFDFHKPGEQKPNEQNSTETKITTPPVNVGNATIAGKNNGKIKRYV